jgi:hypothetical protein
MYEVKVDEFCACSSIDTGMPQFMKGICCMKTVHKVRICKWKLMCPLLYHIKVSNSFISPRKIAHCFLTYHYNKGVLPVYDIYCCM